MKLLKFIQGVPVPRFFPDDAVISALSYEPQHGDVFVVTYPKCGTTWVQCIAYGIYNDGQPPPDLAGFLAKSPFIELFGADAVRSMPPPGTIKTHLPFDEKRFSPRAKYIYVARNPYDVCVSLYHHFTTQTVAARESLSFDEYLRCFLAGEVHFGNYLEGSLLPWYSRRHESNVLFLTYEDLHADVKLQVARIAEFLGKQYARQISVDPAMLQRVIDMSTKQSMRPFFRDFITENVEFVVNYRNSKERSSCPGGAECPRVP
ncbi:hypothetical protein MTO96_000959 [Rhipicephalus appendiculatus]